jgi:hypothetical protein
MIPMCRRTARARPIIFYDRRATCWQPYVKGLTIMVNSISNEPRRHSEDGAEPAGNLADVLVSQREPSLRPTLNSMRLAVSRRSHRPRGT